MYGADAGSCPTAVPGQASRAWHCARPFLGIFTLTFAPWSAAIVLRGPLMALQAQGRLSARDVRLTTRMGRTVRYLIPAFIASKVWTCWWDLDCWRSQR